MMTRISGILVIASMLGACTTLGACGKQDAQVGNVLGAPQRVTSDQARMLSMEPFTGKTRWYAAFAYGQGREVVMVSDPSAAGGSERRLVRVVPGGGYVVSRIRTLCKHGAYVVRDARASKTDAGLPNEASPGDAGIDIRSDLQAICSQTAKVPTFEGRLNTAVAKARSMNDGLAAEGSSPPAAAEAKSKNEQAPKTQVIRLPAKRPEGQ